MDEDQGGFQSIQNNGLHPKMTGLDEMVLDTLEVQVRPALGLYGFRPQGFLVKGNWGVGPW